MRPAASPTWASGMPYANHSKVVIVDDQAHYVGSQNLYDADLAEFGVIIDDQPSTQKLIADYWTKLAQFSTQTTYVDRECR
jgi:phosphatidylserine/phosphatidylglycerophosphate/cardiolipin synthase-like enzyme